MKPGTWQQRRPLTTTNRDTRTGSVTQSFNPNGTYWQKTLTCAGMVQGDFSNPNPWSWSKVESFGAHGKTETFDGRYVVTKEGALGLGFPSVSADSPAWIYNALLSQIADSVRGGVDLSVDAAQAKATARQFRTVDQTVSELARLAKRRFNRASGAAQLIGSKWLEWQYGWRPLIGTVYGSIDNLTNVAINRYSVHKAQVNDCHEQMVRTESNSTWVADQIVREARHQLKLRITTKDSSCLDRWTSLNPASIAWELMPYSFVVDWFWDAGGAMRALETALLNKGAFQSGFYSQLNARRIDRTVTTDRRPAASTPSVRNSYDYENYKSGYHAASFSRTVLTTWPIPNWPSVRADLGSGRLLNAAALLSQYLK